MVFSESRNRTIAKELKGYVVAVLCFSALHLVVTFASNQLDQDALESAIVWINASALILYAVSGFVASAIAKRRHVLNGFIAGLLAALTALVLFGVAVLDPTGKLITLAIGAVFGAAGGAISLLMVGDDKQTL